MTEYSIDVYFLLFARGRFTLPPSELAVMHNFTSISIAPRDLPQLPELHMGDMLFVHCLFFEFEFYLALKFVAESKC